MKEIEHEIDQFYYEMDQGEAPTGNILCIYIDKVTKKRKAHKKVTL